MKHTLSDADRLELRSRLTDLCANGNCHVTAEKPERAMIVSNDLLTQFVQVFSDFYESKNTFSDGIRQEREEETDNPDFKGVAYEKDIDQKALTQGFYKVFEFLAEHPDEWFLDVEISDGTGVYVPSVQRYRSYCRQPEFGGHIINRRRRAGMRIWEYTMIPNKESKIWKKFEYSRIA